MKPKVTKIALLCDLLEEQWTSMDLVADMLFSCLPQHNPQFEVSQLRPPMRERVSKLPGLGSRSAARNTDRLTNRFIDYPRWLRPRINDFDIFHVVDHSYSQLIHELPPARTVVSCHDLDTFKCVLTPDEERRSLPFRLMTTRVLNGMVKAQRILCDSNSVRQELLGHHLIAPERVNVVLHGTHPTCSRLPDEKSDAKAAKLLSDASVGDYILHVGSTIPRKGIETLLRVFAQVRQSSPALKLVRAGGTFTLAQQQLAAQLGITDSIAVMPHLDRPVLASVYRRASLLLLPSLAEGFGLPLVEAMACGCPVVASDIPVLREIGGPDTTFCPIGDIDSWSREILTLAAGRLHEPAKWESKRLLASAWASQFTWQRSASQCAEIYQQVLERQ